MGIIRPYYPTGKRDRPPIEVELILRMYLLQVWFNLSDPGTADAIYDSYVMRKFTGIDFLKDSVLDETMLCNFRHLLEEHGAFVQGGIGTQRHKIVLDRSSSVVSRFLPPSLATQHTRMCGKSPENHGRKSGVL